MVSSGAEIQNLNLDETCIVSGNNYVGGLIGYARMGNVKVKRCGTAATVTATGGNAAGFLGFARKLATVTVQDSYNLGKIVADSLAAAIVAPSLGIYHRLL